MDSSIEGGYKILSHLPFFRRGYLPTGRYPPPLDESLYRFLGEVGKKAYYKVTAVDYALNESNDSQTVSATTYPMTDEQLLDMVQEANFRYYWEGAEPNSGLARENIPGRNDMIATGASGFGIMAIVAGIERGFITREEGDSVS